MIIDNLITTYSIPHIHDNNSKFAVIYVSDQIHYIENEKRIACIGDLGNNQCCHFFGEDLMDFRIVSYEQAIVVVQEWIKKSNKMKKFV